MSGLLGERVVCGASVFLLLLSVKYVVRGGLQDTTRMSMVVVRAALCVNAGSVWALWGRSLYEGVRGAKW